MAKYVIHGIGGSGLVGPEEKLLGGLADEHFSAGDSGGAGLGGLAEQKSLLRIVDGVKDSHVGGQGVRGEGGGLGVGVHADTGGINDDSGRSLGEIGQRDSSGGKFFGQLLGPGSSAVVDEDLSTGMGEAGNYGPRGTTGTEDGNLAPRQVGASDAHAESQGVEGTVKVGVVS